ncbi:MAG: hypothetical protein L6437_12145 [Kiritimatiellae bacterium]|nr:hypothetical protein [Verrucomicrobiota bacterium]MBU4285426.1 hypothetical protein [Verrucomicrobiota bacterium]MBU4367146.1 hypothetical protein [Verrucomicrobiota bacterium]MCG2660982.1 hypothetical protein [Kiritimatiellia bacterium]
MSVLLIIKLKKIIYSGENIGNDLSFRFDVKDQVARVKTRISSGQHKSFSKVLFQGTFAEGSVSLPVSVGITEEDPVFHDTGSGLSSFNVQLQESEPQTHSFNADVIASGGDKGKKATFTFIMEANIRILKVDILQPSPGENHTYAAQPDYNSTGPIAFKAKVEGVNYTGNTDWDVKLEYQTDGGGPYEKTYQFTSPNNQAVNRTFISEGGRLTIKASATVNGIQCSSEITNFITGVGIPDAIITQRLGGLYTPPTGGTAGLLTGIAMNESSYRQFDARITKYGLTARWPVESIPERPDQPSRGSYIGMMQVPVAMDTAWDWLINTQTGADIFVNDKLVRARNKVADLQTTHPGLPNLNGVQLENYALGLYGGHSRPYYAPDQVGGQWQWQTTKNRPLLNYVSKVRKNIQP